MPTATRPHDDKLRIEDLWLGKHEPKEDPRTLKFATYLDFKALPPAPGTLDYTTNLSSIGMMLNDRIGCCTCSACGHIRQVETSMNGHEVTDPDSAILKAYEDVGGYRPDNPNDPQSNATDQGANMLDVCNYWRKTGIAGNKITAFAKVDLTNLTEVKQAMYLFGNVYLGLALPKTAATQIQNNQRWTVVSTSGSGKPGSWGGHAVNIAYYNSRTIGILTWGQKQGMSTGFLKDYGDEAYVVFTQEWINSATQKAPNGFDAQGLMSDLSQFAPAA